MFPLRLRSRNLFLFGKARNHFSSRLNKYRRNVHMALGAQCEKMLSKRVMERSINTNKREEPMSGCEDIIKGEARVFR